MDESQLIEQVKHGDLEAYGDLMKIHMRRLRSFVALRAPVYDMVDEITHETFVYAFQNIRRFETGTFFFSWLKAIAANILRNTIQRYARENANLLKYTEKHLVESGARQDLRLESNEADHLKSCVDSLPSVTRNLLDLKYTQGHSTREIAGILGRSDAWIRTTLFRVREELRKCIESKMRTEAL